MNSLHMLDAQGILANTIHNALLILVFLDFAQKLKNVKLQALLTFVMHIRAHLMTNVMDSAIKDGAQAQKIVQL